MNEQQFNELRKLYFLKCTELNNLKLMLNEYTDSSESINQDDIQKLTETIAQD